MSAGSPAPSAQKKRRAWLIYMAVFLLACLFFWVGMDRLCNIYDEGLILTGAMEVAAGKIPHRDFHANYGPAEFYILGGLFRLFGPSVLIERLLDLIVKAGIVTATFGWCAVYCRKWVALIAAAVCWIWIFSLSIYGSPVMPDVLLLLLGSGMLLSAYSRSPFGLRFSAAGALTGLVALFRYDVGFGVLAAHFCFIAAQAAMTTGSKLERIRTAIRNCCYCAVGTAIVFLPPALMYVVAAPLRPFVFDIVVFSSKYYARARNLPFPGIHLRSLDSLAVYLPIIVLVILIGRYIVQYRRNAPQSLWRSAITDGWNIGQAYLLLGLLLLVLYGKGLVRVSTYGMFLSIVPSLILLALLFEEIPKRLPVLRGVVIAVAGFSLFTASWAALRNARLLFLVHHSSVLSEIFSPPGPASIRDETSWCGTPNPLHRGFCFLVDSDHIRAIQFIDSHTSTSDRLFVGVPHHDRIYANDILTYFSTQRLAATHWYHFDPDLETRADIQRQMISEISSEPVPYILEDSEFDNINEPNDSSKSSGVTLLDDYIRANYQPVESYGAITVWQKQKP